MKSVIAGLVLSALAGCGDRNHNASTDTDRTGDARHGHHSAAHNEENGPHGGRLLRDGDFAVEVTIFETGVEPQLRLFVSQRNKPLDPGTVTASVELIRLGGTVDRFGFEPENDYLKGGGSVREPHSFDVRVRLEHAGKKHAWSYAAYEGRTSIAANVAATAGVKIATAGPGVVSETLILYGRIQPDAERVRSVGARFPGPIRSVARQIGDSVNAGDTLAVIESNESLQTYAVKTPISGVITERHANPGEVATAESLFVVTDFTRVWAELTVFARDRTSLRAGQPVDISAADSQLRAQGNIGFISANASAATPTLTARVALDNSELQWTPGMFVTAQITTATQPAALVVANSALQSFRDFSVVFARVGDVYEVRMLQLGRSDGTVTEVLGGLEAGTEYVVENSYLIKADIEKSGASHDH